MTAVEGRVGEARPGSRRRGRALEQAIFDAVLDQLQSVGYARLTMEGVALAAGTGKAALYRRWDGKDALITAALRDALASPYDIAPQETLRDDVLELLRCMRDASVATDGGAFQAVKVEAGSGLLHGVVQGQVVDPVGDLILEALGRAARRGEVRPDVVTAMVAKVGPAMLTHHLMTQGVNISDEYIDSVLDDVLLPLVRTDRPTRE